MIFNTYTAKFMIKGHKRRNEGHDCESLVSSLSLTIDKVMIQTINPKPNNHYRGKMVVLNKSQN